MDPQRNSLSNDCGEMISIEPLIMEALNLLSTEHPEVVSRSDFLRRVWKNTFSGDESLSRAISVLRKQFKILGEQNRVIETIPKKGYRLTLAAKIHSTNGTAKLLNSVNLNQYIKSRVDNEEPFTLAILPFDDQTVNQEFAHIARGIPEEILIAMATVPNILLIGQTSSRELKKLERGPRNDVSNLSPDFVLKGSIVRQGENIAVRSRLIKSDGQTMIWSKEFSSCSFKFSQIKSRVVESIRNELTVRLDSQQKRSRIKSIDVSPVAYEQHLRGLVLWGERGQSPFKRVEALKKMQAAVMIEPEFADAWAAIGYLGVYSVGAPIGLSIRELTNTTQIALTRALELDPFNVTAHTAFVVWYSRIEIDISKAKKHLEIIQEIAPNRAESHYAAATYWSLIGAIDNAFSCYENAELLDPLNGIIKQVRASRQAETGYFLEAFNYFDECEKQKLSSSGLPVYALIAAFLKDDPETIAFWLPKFLKFDSYFMTLPENRRPNFQKTFQIYVAMKMNDNEAYDKLNKLIANNELRDLSEGIGVWGPRYAEYLSDDTVVEWISYAYDQKILFASRFALSPYYGYNNYPESVLSHPKYIELWDKPKLRELEKIRRENGWNFGLPIR